MISFRKRIWSLANMLIEFSVGIGTIIFVTRLYSTADTGVWFLFIAIFGVAASLRDAFIQPALVKDSVGKTGTVLYSVLKANLTVTFYFEMLSIAIICCCALWTNSSLSDLLIWYPLYSIANSWQRWQIFFLRSRLELDTITKGAVVALLVLLIGLMVIISFQLPMTSLIVALGCSSLAGGIYLSQKVHFSKILNVRINRSHYRSVWSLGSFAVGREATSSISSRISLFITSSLLSLQLTAILGISQRFAQIALLPNNSFQSVLFPGLMKAIQEDDQMKARKLFHDSLSLLLAMTIPASIIGIIASPYILTWLSGPQYAGSWLYLAIYVFIATLITPFGAAFGSAITAWGKPQLAFRLVLVNSILNISLSFILIKSLGLVGAPLSMVIVEVFGLCCVSYLLKKTSGIHILDTFRQIPLVYLNAFKKITTWFPTTPLFITLRNKI